MQNKTTALNYVGEGLNVVSQYGDLSSDYQDGLKNTLIQFIVKLSTDIYSMS